MNFNQLPLSDNVPKVVSENTQLLTAWELIQVWHAKIIHNRQDSRMFCTSACFIMMACRFINLRVSEMMKKGLAERLAGALIIKKMQEVSAELKGFQRVADWLGHRSSLQASVDVGIVLFNTLYQIGEQHGLTQPLPKAALLSTQQVWTMISLVIEIAPEPQIAKKSEVSARLSWLDTQQARSSKHQLDEEAEAAARSKKPKTTASVAVSATENAVFGRIQVSDPQDLETIKRYDESIGIVPITGPVKNRSVVTAIDMLTLRPGQELNDVIIDAHLTLICHTANDLFQQGVELPRTPRYHSWSAQMSSYLESRVGSFEDRHLRQEWPPAHFPHAVLEDVATHIFPVLVATNHWVLMVFQKDGTQMSLYCFSSLAGYNKMFEKPWEVIASWLFFKSNGALDARKPVVIFPDPQPRQNNQKDCGVFVCGIVRWQFEGWDLSTLTPSIIPEYRRRMLLEIERWFLSTHQG